MLHFTKMHGIGNDYIYINGFEETLPADLPALAREMSPRHTSVGSDGVIFILPSKTADVRMRMFNPDGTEAEMCGNGVRCVAAYSYDRGLCPRTQMSVETGGGLRHAALTLDDLGRTDAVRIDMGEPVLKGEDIPSVFAGEPVKMRPLEARGKSWPVTLVNVGNPHAVIFVKDIAVAPVGTVGPILEMNAAFPRRANIEFVQVTDRERLSMRVWERGAGETRACGTGACASMVAAVLNGLTGRSVTVKLSDGELKIVWDEQTNHINMTGPVAYVYDGIYLNGGHHH
ncbi:MAG: diaminopimelate epimerase [Clostridiales bacterium]|nr:diaminopimelate epimerase [Clostridiales bacterium]